MNAQGTIRVADTRVSLDSVVYAFNRGENAVEIQKNFDTLTLAQIHAAIAYYLHNKVAVDEYLERKRFEYEQKREEDRTRPDHITMDMLRARKNGPRGLQGI